MRKKIVLYIFVTVALVSGFSDFQELLCDWSDIWGGRAITQIVDVLQWAEVLVQEFLRKFEMSQLNNVCCCSCKLEM